MKDEMKKIEDAGFSHSEPVEYWETCDARLGGVISSINENRLCIRSHVNMRIGGELRLRVFFKRGDAFDGFHVLAKILGKDVYSEADWEAYEYELEISKISAEGHLN